MNVLDSGEGIRVRRGCSGSVRVLRLVRVT